MKDDPDRKKIAIVATAHYLTRVSMSMLKSGETWREAIGGSAPVPPPRKPLPPEPGTAGGSTVKGGGMN